MLSKTIKIGNLFKALGIDNDCFYEVQTVNEEILIETPTGYVPIRGFVIKNDIETVDANVNGVHIKGADKHLVKINDEWKTLDAFEHKKLGKRNCYDVAVDAPHEYLTANGIINHNTSIAKAIVNDLRADYIYLNASSENSIDVIRTQIAGFAQTMSFTSGKKIVILDEADGLTPQFQKALRAYMEEFQENCRFILTCNQIGKIIEPLRQGRTMCFDFDMSKYKEELIPQVVKRVKDILRFEKVEFVDGIVEKIVERTFPSVRKAISFVQQYAETHDKIDENAVPKNLSKELVKIFAEGSKPNVSGTRLYIEQEGISPVEVYHALFEEFVNSPHCAKKAQATILLADYESRTSQSSDPTLQVAACLIELAGCWQA